MVLWMIRMLKDKYLFNRFIDRRLKTYFGKYVSNSTRDYNKVIMVITNVTCNIKCFCCATFCDTEIGSNLYNKDSFILKPSILNEFLKNISDFRPKNYISLQGGETTLLKSDLIKDYTKIIKDNNRKVLILTNGYGIRKVDPFIFDRIILDEHMQNNEDIKKAITYFEILGYKDFSINLTKYHYDLRSIMKDERIDNSFKCNDMLDAITLHNKTVFPCCVSPMLMGYDNRKDYVEDLIVSGFVYNNNNLSKMLNNINEYLPPSFYDVCMNYCYRRRVKAKKIYKPTNFKK